VARTFFSRAFKERPYKRAALCGGKLFLRATIGRPYKRAALCGYKISKKTNFRERFGWWAPGGAANTRFSCGANITPDNMIRRIFPKENYLS
jgi:hypothetical protein